MYNSVNICKNKYCLERIRSYVWC